MEPKSGSLDDGEITTTWTPRPDRFGKGGGELRSGADGHDIYHDLDDPEEGGDGPDVTL
ncbi:hypothetical protein [Streptomyces sp. NPDC007369]|uniref:hypothetical protein n=1 Tax=Streptomyces sp. NPDC007369 TaxID=3154589 RepID=UPI003403AD43